MFKIRSATLLSIFAVFASAEAASQDTSVARKLDHNEDSSNRKGKKNTIEFDWDGFREIEEYLNSPEF